MFNRVLNTPPRVGSSKYINSNPVNIYLFKANHRNTREGCEICSKLTIETLERRQRRCSGVFIVNFEHFTSFSSAPIVDYELVNVSWVIYEFSKSHLANN